MSYKLPVSVLVVVHTAALDVLASGAEFHAEQGAPFFALFVDPDGKLDLDDLFREA